MAIAALMHKRKAIAAEIKPEYTAITKERIALTEKGELRIRPRERPVYDPNGDAKSIPPKTIELNREYTQPLLFSENESHQREKGN